ncbi:NUDIX hydrolase [Flexivirga caeni]|uniref:NUDIX domain-containing protein n=1 Tax=Flexivirga caeni TaxID=2294115 RepID=A0A3M9LZD6_9MICO|nr:NUDIX domain-containing protein [Flexivirga caeni]RNI18295.1 NUDIX domain-containing protein [Flexivirga caeni]
MRDFEAVPRVHDLAVNWLARPAAERVPGSVRLASTVLLLREAASGAEVFMQHRASSMPFAPSMWVFPGGGVDPRDESGEVPWAGPAVPEWAQRLGVPEPVAQALVVAAVREVFEECGVLLAGPSAHEIISQPNDEQWQEDRARLADHSLAFSDLLRDRQLVLRSDLLAVQDHWVTPEMEPRRYDTWFFSALMPAEQVADDRTTEASEAGWHRPADVLREASAGAASLLPPTVVQLQRVSGWGSFDPVTTSRAGLLPVMPEPVQVGDRVVLRAQLND